MEKIKITGHVYHIGQIEQISDKFKKREFVIKTIDQYPQLVLIQVVNDRCDILDNVQLNDAVDAFINIRGREWTDRNGARKFFNTLEAWQIQIANIVNRPDVNPGPIPQNAQPQQIQNAQPQQTNYDPLGLIKNDGSPF
ncbi:Protein of unknown function DUF3127 [uncultured Caudovirales phage]|uniref:DUF3127 domain-containing protein n=1 Tax=uncultured Caudovirales phage TaxID=2100421 RepID=A0A6J5N2X2_9CAUD|nr:Protein of unknown function DUF3127 [uncultured Caudovirales phage]